MHILFLTHYFPPEVNAPASRTYEHCLRWVRAGHRVTVITCVPNCPDGVVFDGYRNRVRPQVENVDGIQVIRVWTHVAANAGTLHRIINFLSYMISATLAAWRVKSPDLVVATSPQFFCGWAGVFVSRMKNRPLVLEVRDIWPESIQAVGALRNRYLLRILEALEQRMYAAADLIVTVGQGYRQRILDRIGKDRRIEVVTNGVDLERFQTCDDANQFRQQYRFEEKFVCSYIGTIGMAHGLEVVLKAAQLLKQQDRTDVVFCLIGDGARRKQLEQQVRESGLDEWIVFLGRQPRHVVPSAIAASDACLIHLKECELFGTVIPSKMFEAMAMGRPIIMGVRGEARDIVVGNGAGLAMEPDSPSSLVSAIDRLSRDADLRASLGAAARRVMKKSYNRDHLAEEFLRLLQALCENELLLPLPISGSAVPQRRNKLEPSEHNVRTRAA